eukprot:7086734-Pyramimonas_sp.AAC.1
METRPDTATTHGSRIGTETGHRKKRRRNQQENDVGTGNNNGKPEPLIKTALSFPGPAKALGR